MMKEVTLVSQLQSPAGGPKASGGVGGGFAETLGSAISKVNQAQVDSDRAIEGLHTGEAKNLHEVMITMEQADISLRLMVQMRNKVVDAYQEIMRLSV